MNFLITTFTISLSAALINLIIVLLAPRKVALLTWTITVSLTLATILAQWPIHIQNSVSESITKMLLLSLAAFPPICSLLPLRPHTPKNRYRTPCPKFH
jgi:hypothetical protein